MSTDGVDERLWKPSEVGALFRCHPDTVNRWIRQGRMSAVSTPTGRYLIPHREIQRMLQEGVIEDGE